MASHISGPAANSQQRQYSTDSVGEQYAPKRSSLQHISELIKLAKKRDLMGAKNAAVMPWIVPRHHRVIKPEENFDHTYNLCTASRIFVTFDDANSSKVAFCINMLVMLVLIVSCIQYVVVTIPSVQTQPDSCSNPVCHDDAVLCPGRMVCEPRPPHWVSILETVCVSVFTVDYVARVLTCAHTPARLCGVVPLSLALSEAAPGDPEWDMIRRYKNPDYVELWWVTMHRYMLQPLNLIDLVAIIPFYVKLLGGSGSSLSIIRILRLARVVRLIRSGRGGFSKGLLILSNTLVSSAPMNAFLFCVALVIFVVCGSIGYLIEGGEFTVTEDYPEGVYMRPNLLGTHLEPSPFISVLHGIYWSVVTSTTVGYGDMYPTTWAGRVFACACTFLGIVVIALPVTVLGNHFGKEYEREYIGQNANDAENAGDILPSDTNSVEALPDNTDLGSDIRQDGLELASCHLASSNSTCRKIIVGRKPLDAADVESAAKSVRRLEDMANELQLVIRTMKDELEIHRANLNRQSSPPPFDSDSIGLKEGIQMQR